LFATFLLGQQAAQVTNDPGQPSQAQEPNAAPAPQSNAENPPDPGFPTNPVEAAPQPQPGGPSQPSFCSKEAAAQARSGRDAEFRGVSAGALPPPPTAKQAFIIATENSFDYSSFVFVGISSAMASGAMPTAGIAQGISLSYYPSQTRTAGAITQKYAYAIGRDAFTNVFREFWRGIAMHVLHRNP